MGIFSKSKNKKMSEKKGGYQHEPAKPFVEEKKTTTVKPEITTITTPEKPKLSEKQVQFENKPAQASKVPDPNLEFQMMYGLADVAEPLSPEVEKNVAKTLGKTTSTVSEATVTEVKPVVESKPVEIIPGGGFSSYTKKIFPKPPVKRFINKQLTIILVENTETMAREKDKVIQLVQSFAQSDLVCIINYGEKIAQSEIFEISSTEKPDISYNEMTGEKVRLFDALVKLEKLVSSNFVRITYQEAVDLLKKANVEWEFTPNYESDIAKEHEKYITEYYNAPVFITNWPKDIKAWYMKENADGRTVAAVDLEVPGAGELMGGSQREEDYDTIIKRAQSMGVDLSVVDWYLNLRKYGGCIHSGFGMGFERLIMYLTGIENIRDVIPFPRTPKNCEF